MFLFYLLLKWLPFIFIVVSKCFRLLNKPLESKDHLSAMETVKTDNKQTANWGVI